MVQANLELLGCSLRRLMAVSNLHGSLILSGVAVS